MQIAARLKKIACVVSSLALLGASLGPVQAALVSTQTVLEQARITPQREQLLALAGQQDVQVKLVALGLDAGTAADRVARMTDAEVADLAERLEGLPAGGDGLGTVALVFLVLLITDIAGITDIFPFVKK